MQHPDVPAKVPLLAAGSLCGSYLRQTLLGPLAQPELLETGTREAALVLTRGETTTAGAVVAPLARDV